MIKRKGFTLVEVAVAVVIGLIILSVIVSALGGGTARLLDKTVITVDSHDGSDTYYVDEYTEKDGCIEFTDWQGHHRICGNYRIRD